MDPITVAILAKNKAHVLPLYLQCLERQTYPASLIHLYIRTNNNNDDTAAVLRDWVNRVGHRYAEVFWDDSDVPERVQDYSPHEWNSLRLRVLCRLRQASVEWAKARNSHYFIADCDNFIQPDTLETLMNTGLPVIGPLLRNGDDMRSFYSNYHHRVDSNGYYKASTQYYDILYQQAKGLIEVEVIHCTYLVRREVLHLASYIDGTDRYDYVIFSDTWRKSGIPQYIDNRRLYGKLTFCDTAEEFAAKGITFETLGTVG